MLSDIERGAKSPTIALLAGVAEALSLPLSVLVDDTANKPSRSPRVIRAAKQLTITDASGVRRTNLAGQYADSTVEFVRFKLPRRTESGTFAAHGPGTIERIHVESGTLQVKFGDKRVTLHAGDTLLYEARVSHSFANLSDKVATVYLIVERKRLPHER
jgi:XRE family transcriptional regulator, regulator of sulfur utilization